MPHHRRYQNLTVDVIQELYCSDLGLQVVHTVPEGHVHIVVDRLRGMTFCGCSRAVLWDRVNHQSVDPGWGIVLKFKT
jgi:hypothetical protein